MISEEQCKEILYKYKRNAVFKKFEIQKFSNDTLGFLGDHYSLKIFYDDSGTRKSTTFFLKTFPRPSQDHIQYVNELGVFEKEALLYRNLMHRLQVYYNEPFAPKMYLTDCKEYIVLEDLDRKGFSNPLKSLSLEQCEAVLRCLARLHAASIVFEEKQREKVGNFEIFDEFTEEFKEVSFSKYKDHPRNKWCANVLKAVLDCMEVMPECRIPEYKLENVTKNLRCFVENCIYDLIKPSKTYRNCVTHCDLWSNNIMFKTTEANHVECILVDFQFARYIPPVYDVLLTLYLNLSFQHLENDLNRLLLYYYDNLKRYLAEHLVDIKRILPVSEFWDSVDHYKKLAVVEAAWFGTIAFIGDNLAKKITSDHKVFVEFSYSNRSKHLLKEFDANPEYRRKMEDLIRQIGMVFK